MTAMATEAPARAAAGDSPVIPLLIIGTGAYLAWFALRYWRDKTTTWPSTPIKSVLQGNGLPAPDRPQTIAQDLAGGAQSAAAEGNLGPVNPGGNGNPQVAGGTVTGKDIAADAAKYRGHHYLYGGAPGRNGQSPWDCSSFVNWVVGHDMKMSVPGFSHGSYDGSTHGPATGSWLTWTGCKTVPRSQVAAGDLCVWQTHMGIAISSSQMISAQDPSAGTQVSSISGGGPPGELLVCRALRETLITPTGGKGAAANQNTARLLTQKYGWSSSQNQGEWQALVELWDGESNWSTTATNPGSGAYGIPQALPGSKMASAGALWKTSAKVQITWGLRYIKQRYGSPIKALAFKNANGYY